MAAAWGALGGGRPAIGISAEQLASIAASIPSLADRAASLSAESALPLATGPGDASSQGTSAPPLSGARARTCSMAAVCEQPRAAGAPPRRLSPLPQPSATAAPNPPPPAAEEELAARKAALARFKEKKSARSSGSGKKVRYEMRRINAEKRPVRRLVYFSCPLLTLCLCMVCYLGFHGLERGGQVALRPALGAAGGRRQ